MFKACAVAEIVPPVAEIAADVAIAAYSDKEPPATIVAIWASPVAGVALSEYFKFEIESNIF